MDDTDLFNGLMWFFLLESDSKFCDAYKAVTRFVIIWETFTQLPLRWEFNFTQFCVYSETKFLYERVIGLLFIYLPRFGGFITTSTVEVAYTTTYSSVSTCSNLLLIESAIQQQLYTTTAETLRH